MKHKRAKRSRATSEELTAVVLGILEEENKALELEDLLSTASKRGFTYEVPIKAAIWELIANAAVQLTSDRKLRLHHPV